MNDHTTPTRRPGLRDEIAEALIAWTYRGKDPEHNGILETVRANAYSRADAVLAVLYREWPWLRAEAEDTAPVDRTALREIAAQAIRDAACTGDCGQTEEECRAERIQPFVWRHGVLAVVEGSPEQFADAVLAAVLPAPVDPAALVRACASFVRDTYSGEWADDAAATLETDADKIERGEPCSLLRLAAVLPATTNHATDTAAELERLRAELDGTFLYRKNAELHAEVERLRVDRAAVLREAADHLDNSERLRDLTDDHMLDINAAANELRRVADETAATETQARRGDQFEAWLKQQRDSFGWQGANDRRLFDTLDGILDRYRLHADTGTPLGEHLCEGRVVGDCECLEQPAAGARQDGAQQ